MVDKKKILNISIIGFMATGKTTIGKELSERLNLEFIDIDKLIEEKMKTTISEISCGGGTCLDSENILNIRKNSRVILLEADPETIVERTENDETRPLLKDRKGEEAIRKIMENRRDSYYKAADIIIDTNNKSTSSIIDEIIKKIGVI